GGDGADVAAVGADRDLGARGQWLAVGCHGGGDVHAPSHEDAVRVDGHGDLRGRLGGQGHVDRVGLGAAVDGVGGLRLEEPCGVAVDGLLRDVGVEVVGVGGRDTVDGDG